MSKTKLKNTKFKALWSVGNYVDAKMLHKGIYITDIPSVFHQDDTIDAIIDRARTVINLGINFLNEQYFENLKQCELREIEINISTSDKLCVSNAQKANRYDELRDKIAGFYNDDNIEGDLASIGEIAASHFNFL